MVSYIPKITDMEESNYNKIAEIVKHQPKVFSSPDFIKLNRCVSYMTFILKECWEYFSSKTSDGVLIFKLRKINKEMEAIKSEIAKLNNIE